MTREEQRELLRDCTAVCAHTHTHPHAHMCILHIYMYTVHKHLWKWLFTNFKTFFCNICVTLIRTFLATEKLGLDIAFLFSGVYYVSSFVNFCTYVNCICQCYQTAGSGATSSLWNPHFWLWLEVNNNFAFKIFLWFIFVLLLAVCNIIYYNIIEYLY